MSHQSDEFRTKESRAMPGSFVSVICRQDAGKIKPGSARFFYLPFHVSQRPRPMTNTVATSAPSIMAGLPYRGGWST